MNASVRNKLIMYETVGRVIAANEATWIGIPAFQSIYAEFTTALQPLKNNVEHHSLAIKGITKAKNRIKEELIVCMDRLTNLMRVYAQSTGNLELEAQVHTSAASMRVLSGASLLARATNLKTLIDLHGSNLEPYGFQGLELNTFEALISNYRNALGLPRLALVQRQQITLAINEQIKIIDALLKKKLDPFATALKVQAPDFVIVYKAARKIIQLRGRRYKTRSDGIPEAGTEGA